jgi:hypothetical protein
MPKAAVHEHNGATGWQYNVWPAGQATVPKRKAEAKAMQERTHPPLRSRILAADSTHVPTSTLWSQMVHITPPTSHRDQVDIIPLRTPMS